MARRGAVVVLAALVAAALGCEPKPSKPPQPSVQSAPGAALMLRTAS
jgi:hypothetical protein